MLYSKRRSVGDASFAARFYLCPRVAIATLGYFKPDVIGYGVNYLICQALKFAGVAQPHAPSVKRFVIEPWHDIYGSKLRKFMLGPIIQLCEIPTISKPA